MRRFNTFTRSWTGSKPRMVTRKGNYGQVPFSELAMSTCQAGRQVKRIAIFGEPDRPFAWAHVLTDRGVLDGLPHEVIPFECREAVGLS